MAETITRRSFLSKLAKRLAVVGVAASSASCVLTQERTLEEVVSEINTPWLAQMFINTNINYAYGDIVEFAPKPASLNGSNVQSFSRTFDRKKGICKDGAVAIAAMLQDNGYPSIILVIQGYNGVGHAIFAYEESGKWGSAGINACDFERPVYSSLRDLAQVTATKFNDTLKSYVVYDASNQDLVYGSSNVWGTDIGIVQYSPFAIKSEGSGDEVLNAVITKTQQGHHIYSQRRSIILGEYEEEETYTEDIFLDSRVRTTFNEKYSEEETYNYRVLARDVCGLPTQEETEYLNHDSNGISGLDFLQARITYDSQGRRTTSITDKTRNGIFSCLTESQFEYNQDGSGYEVHFSDLNADFFYEVGMKIIFDSNNWVTDVITVPGKPVERELI